MSGTFEVKNFARFQHYKDRSPPWIKLYNELLDDYEFSRLPDASKAHLLAIWLLASRYENKIPYDAEWVSRRINATSPVNLPILEKSGFIVLDQDCSDMLADCKQNACLETEVETEVEVETQERKEEPSLRSINGNSESKGHSGKYYFESGTVRLNEKDFKNWKEAFPNLDLKAELIAMTPWADELGPSKWFYAMAAALNKKNSAAKIKLEQARAAGPASQRHTHNDPLAGIN